MADNDFRVTMIDPSGGEFIAGSPEVVARLTAQGYRQKPNEEQAAVADEQEQAAAVVPNPPAMESGNQGPVTGETAGDSSPTEPAPKQAPSPKPSGRK